MRIFGIDPGSLRTGYGCIDSDGSRHRLVTCGAIAAPPRLSFPERLHAIHAALAALLAECRPDGVAVESLFHAINARSALQLGHARGVALLAASQAGLPIAEYAPAEVKRAVVGYGRAEKLQVRRMIHLLLGVADLPGPHDVSDALAVAICHIHCAGVGTAVADAIAQADSRAASSSTTSSGRGRGRSRGAVADAAGLANGSGGRRTRGTNWRRFNPDELIARRRGEE